MAATHISIPVVAFNRVSPTSTAIAIATATATITAHTANGAPPTDRAVPRASTVYGVRAITVTLRVATAMIEAVVAIAIAVPDAVAAGVPTPLVLGMVLETTHVAIIRIVKRVRPAVVIVVRVMWIVDMRLTQPPAEHSRAVSSSFIHVHIDAPII